MNTACPRPHAWRSYAFGLGLLPLAAQAEFLADSSANLDLRNFYQLRDYRQREAPQSQAGSWSQGFVLRLQSGFTEGPLGFGLDATGLLGVKLDSGRGRSNDGTLPFGPNSKEPVDDYSHLGLTAKLRYSQTQLQVGILMPQLPVVFRDDMRLLPQTFDGALLTSSEIEGLTLTAGQLWKSRTRESAGSDDMYIMGRDKAHASDEFNLAGATYAFTPRLSASYYYGQLKDIYQQHYLGLLHTLPLGEGLSLRSDLRYFDSDADGAAISGPVDNRNLNGMLTLRAGAHAFGIGFQKMIGNDAFPVLNGYTPPYVANLMTIQTFTRPREKSWQLRYDHDFAGLGLPGLNFMTRYVQGRDIDRGAGRADDNEWERNTDLSYVIQSGPLKSVALKWRNVTYRSRYGADMDENRFIVNYTVKLW
ncbi:OprD family porin [Pseudomonas aeruginosa]|uniref:OprD family porin n=1 Tax=Pseudomonas aeruginosa TaxID=287 RepID=UPI001573D059|nr:OprD family porin [Pseudomonas aeruginosa]MCV4188096.1 OprD family porin [Pseudomonas aeruginosa]NTS94876.1 OprD family porin [Pseudomonas aeruginosa]